MRSDSHDIIRNLWGDSKHGVTFSGQLVRSMAVLILVLCADGPRIRADEDRPGSAKEPFSVSYQAGQQDASGRFMGGTEIVQLIPFHGKLYAGVGYWTDKPDYFPDHVDPSPGPQILVLDTPRGKWQQEMAFAEKDPAGENGRRFSRVSLLKVVVIQYDGSGRKLAAPVELFVAGLDGFEGGGKGALFSRNPQGMWEPTNTPGTCSFRSLAVHHDPISHVDRIFVGGVGQIDPGSRRSGLIVSGVYDPSAPGRIAWDPNSVFRQFGGRPMALGEVNSKLYAFAKPTVSTYGVYQFHDDQGRWTQLIAGTLTSGKIPVAKNSGLRGLTAIGDPICAGRQVMLGAIEGVPGEVLRIDPDTAAAVHELNIDRFLEKNWGTMAGYNLAAYSDMPLIHTPDGRDVRFIGLLVVSPDPVKRFSAWYLIRNEAGAEPRYALREIRPIARDRYCSDPKLFSIRTIVVSPFPEDYRQAVYFGGYDGAFNTNHNTAWIYRAGLRTALETVDAKGPTGEDTQRRSKTGS